MNPLKNFQFSNKEIYNSETKIDLHKIKAPEKEDWLISL